MAETTRDSADTVALALYRELMLPRTQTLADAARSLGLDAHEIALGTERLQHLGLITRSELAPESIIQVNPEVALVRALSVGRQELDRYRDRVAAMNDQIEHLVTAFLPLGGGTPGELSVTVMTDLRQVAAYLDSAADLARTEVLAMHPGPAPAPHLLAEGSTRNAQLAQRNLRLRTLYQRRVATLPYMADRLRDLTGMGYEIRVAEMVPLRLLICDRTRAMVQIDPANGAAGAIAIEGETLVRSLVAVFDYCWQNATDFEDAASGDAPQLSPQEQAILRMLAAGLKDEKIARNLGVSLRTVTRCVSLLMQKAGAESRFQAGIRAIRLGWLD